jgi:flagella basal body P-ring formation protein FlgA
MPRYSRFILLLAALLSGAVAAAEWQDIAALKIIAEGYVRLETSDLPGKVAVTIGSIDPQLRLAACVTPEAFTPVGTRLWGNATVGIRCADPKWSISAPIVVKVTAGAVVATRALARNRIIEAADLAQREADLTQLPAGVLTDPAQGIGKLTTIGIPAGSFLKNQMLRAPFLVLHGQKIKLLAQGRGFKVNAEGTALADGSAGQVISVRTTSGKTVSGVVKSVGVVEVAF